MCDKLVFDLSQEVEGSPNVFIRKDWINILDNQNQNYQNNQSIIDTSQLTNSNKYLSYREAYLAVPLTLSMVTPAQAHANNANNIIPVVGQGTSDYAIGLKNWFGQLIHSFTVDYNGTTIIQQTPFINMWNSFKLLTTLSYSDLITQGQTIGFYPDTSNSWNYLVPNGNTAANVPGNGGTISKDGVYTCNNTTSLFDSPVTNISSIFSANGNQITRTANVSGLTTTQQDGAGVLVPVNVNIGGNTGLTKRISWINYNPRVRGQGTTAYGSAINNNAGIVGITANSANQVWKSYISQQIDASAAQCGLMQISVMATIYLKHISAFYNMIPLLKGVFMKLTMNLNNASTSITITPYVAPVVGPPVVFEDSPHVSTYASTVPVGGTLPLLIPSFSSSSFNSQGYAFNAFGATNQTSPLPGNYWYNLSIGSTVLDPNITSGGYAASALKLGTGQLSKSIYLYVPAYTFNPVFEEAYLSNPVKQIKYTDVYQYQVQNIVQGSQFNNLITNGIANIKSILLIPFFSQINNLQTANGTVASNQPSPVYQSPFDPAGAGCTSPMVTLGNFNIQISGQNAIYNTQRYTFEQFNDQLYGQLSVNGGLTDGLTSGLIGYQDFLQTYGYYYVNVERMLPVEQSVPKSVQILGTNYSTQNIDLWVFVEYGVEVNIDLTTGARV